MSVFVQLGSVCSCVILNIDNEIDFIVIEGNMTFEGVARFHQTFPRAEA